MNICFTALFSQVQIEMTSLAISENARNAKRISFTNNLIWCEINMHETLLIISINKIMHSSTYIYRVY